MDSLAEPADLLGHSYGATVALGAAPLARNLRRLILYEPAPGIRQADPDLLSRLEALLAKGEREQLLSVFLTEVGLEPRCAGATSGLADLGAARGRRAHDPARAAGR